MNSLTFKNLSPESYNALCTEAQASGISLAQINLSTDAPQAVVAGQVESHGCKIAYGYNRASRALTVTVADKPWLFPMSTVLGELRSVIVTALQKAGATWTE